MYYTASKHFCQVVVSNNPVLSMVICEEDLCAISAAFDLKHCCVAELSAIGDADEATAGEVRTFVAGKLSRTSQVLRAVCGQCL